ncbi:MAG: preprotein translocase subunit SecA [Campylobacteraceae bacterium]|jgi:preprotein translocase subunit SecA|nr:preprotein translocase subunit SecA [Campylobacteraceae bacterium]
MFIETFLGKVFGTRNDREIKKYAKRAAEINELEKRYKSLNDDELRGEFTKLKEEVRGGKKSLDDVLNDVFAITREASVRTTGLRHFDVQLIGGLVLHDGNIAEMKTGEGKTLVATLPVVLNAMEGKGVHIVTVNDYLAKRDATDMGKIYNFLGLSVGVILSTSHDEKDKKEQYAADITYGTNNEFGFDYLRDNMKYSFDDKVQREHNFAIVDEVDSILIDEARTPLIISGHAGRKLENYQMADSVAREFKKDEDFTLDEKNRTVLVTESGIAKAENLFKVDNLYSLENAILSHLLDQALKAHYLFEKDVHYVLRGDEIVIVDEFTGRLSEGRRFSEGLHQALEAKEHVKIQDESQTLADITFQNYFRSYKKLAGMTGTAQTEASEFSQIYKLDVISVPTNVPAIREDKNDLIYKSEAEKFKAVIDDIKASYKKGQPVLVGTASIEKSELLHSMLEKAKIPHSVLNAKNHEKEAQIIAEAGAKGAVTIATNMAGRGVDIKINDEVKSLGGLYVIGTERHESRRIDNQLRGRSGRQGDPGKSRFYLSLEDNLLRIFGSERIKNIMERLGIKDGESIDSRMVTRAVENAQKKVETLHFESRKHLLEYDDVANEQRKTIYNFRNELLGKNLDMNKRISEMRKEYVKNLFSNAGIYDGIPKEDRDIDRVLVLLKEELNCEIGIDNLKELETDEIFNIIDECLKNEYEQKMSVVDDEQRGQIERILSLQILDTTWREHLYQMDILKTGIGLRGYNQKDPLTEYKKESYGLFVELVGRIRGDTFKMLQVVRLRDNKAEEERKAMERMLKEMEDTAEDVSFKHGSEEISQGESKFSSKKIARNDLCPCGSGKKYKFCHGKSGPKKGLLA